MIQHKVIMPTQVLKHSYSATKQFRPQAILVNDFHKGMRGIKENLLSPSSINWHQSLFRKWPPPALQKHTNLLKFETLPRYRSVWPHPQCLKKEDLDPTAASRSTIMQKLSPFKNL